ncbi:MAG: hypothetical protein WCJ30_06905 [Deltaproteobacteria bacterium]
MPPGITPDPTPGARADSAHAVHNPARPDLIAQLIDQLNAPSEIGLSPEILVAMAGRRLHDIDAQISSAMKDMNARGSKLAFLRAATEGISAFRQSHATDAPMDLNGVHVDVTMPDGTTENWTLHDALIMGGTPPSALPASNTARNDTDIGHLADSIRTQIDQVNEGADIAQLSLQQLISSRGQVTQTVSQLLAALHENAKAILQNTRA